MHTQTPRFKVLAETFWFRIFQTDFGWQEKYICTKQGARAVKL